MPWKLILVCIAVSVVMTVLLRPEIFIKALTGGTRKTSGNAPPRLTKTPPTPTLNTPPDTSASTPSGQPPSENHHG